MICMYLENATAQEVFDKVATHLLAQMERAADDIDGICQYRVGALSCAAGCLIPDEEYDKDLVEGEGWIGLADNGIVPKNHLHLIGRLQVLHDVHLPHSWKKQLEILAEYEGLDAFQRLPITKESP